jgi:3-phenylpropionate/trans-cinnamate dioxygenase ferredoxin reductase subunit
MAHPPVVVVLGAGAAGSAAAAQLTAAGATVTLADGGQPINRTLVNKGITTGMLSPDQIALPTGAIRTDTAVAVDTTARTIAFRSGTALGYDGLVVATGSHPRVLPDSIPGVAQAARTGLLTTVHSVQDGTRIRDRLVQIGTTGRVAILGGGLVAAETASLLAATGHDLVLVTRAPAPGEGAFGPSIASRLADAHRRHLQTRFGRTLTSIDHRNDALHLTLDDGDRITADLVLVAHGTTPAGPAPWSNGVEVDDRLRAVKSDRVVAAGGVALHHIGSGTGWRIDHWADAAAQGTHAAHTLLHELTGSADPGPYRPVSIHSAQIHDQLLMAAGNTGPGTQVTTTDSGLQMHHRNGSIVGVAALNDPLGVHSFTGRLHRPAVPPPPPATSREDHLHEGALR